MKPKIKPRNPYVASAKFRKAGLHGKPAKSQRQQDKLGLHKVVKQLPQHWQKRSLIEFASANAVAFYSRRQYCKTFAASASRLSKCVLRSQRSQPSHQFENGGVTQKGNALIIADG